MEVLFLSMGTYDPDVFKMKIIRINSFFFFFKLLNTEHAFYNFWYESKNNKADYDCNTT